MNRRVTLALLIAVVGLNGVIIAYRKYQGGHEADQATLAREVVDKIKQQYLEDSHQIVVKETQGPVSLRMRFTPADVGKTWLYRESFLSDSQHRGDVGLVREYLETCQNVAEDGRSAEFTASSSLKASAVTAAEGSPSQSVDQITEECFYKFVLAADGDKSYLTREEKVVGVTLQCTYYAVPDTQWPNRPLKVGEKWTKTSSQLEKAPSEVKKDPPRMSLELKDIVDFDGEPAALIERESVDYALLEGPNKLLLKTRNTRRGYVALATGRLLWQQTQQVIESPKRLHRVVVLRTELQPSPAE